jgi:chemotaxis protein MotB
MKRLCVVLAMLATGCVTQGTYELLQKDRDSLKAQLDQSKADTAEVQARLEKTSKDLGEKIAKLTADLSKTEDDLSAMTQLKTALEAEKSAMLTDKRGLQASIDDMRTALAELSKRKAEADARLAEFKRLLNRFKSLIDAGKLQVKIVDGRMVVALASDVLFASGSAKLSKDGEAAIAEVARLLIEIPDRKFQVEGHTDNVPMKSAAYASNWELAAARALTVVKTMIDAGLPGGRISAASFGEFKPAWSNDTQEGRGANRRIEIVVVPDLSSLPGFDELKKVGQ